MKSQLIIFFSVISFSLFSQEKLELQKITLGLMTPVIATEKIGDGNNFKTYYDLRPSMNFLTSKTHHHMMYSFGGNNLQTMHGFALSDEFGIYGFFSKNLSKKDKYLGIGGEKFIFAGKDLVIVIWSEVGTDFENGNFLSFGVTIHPQIKIWEKK